MTVLIVNLIFTLAFIVFAYFNFNDKDAWLWVTIYLVAAALCALAAFGRFYPSIYLIVLAAYLVYAGILFFAKDGVRDWMFKYHRPSIAESMQATKPYIEQTREFFGLLICCAALAINYFISR